MKRKVLILGANGMLGHTLYSELSKSAYLDVYGTVRNNQHLRWFQNRAKIFTHVFAGDMNTLSFILKNLEPEYVINCVGVHRQSEYIKNPIMTLKINSLFPHTLSEECEKTGCKLIHFSSDYVFNGKKGMYTEKDTPCPEEMYGCSKRMGEVSNKRNTLTIRGSFLGHELETSFSLVEWFLSQKNKVYGHKNFYSSGITSLEIAKIINSYIFPNSLSGIIHISSSPISKYDLLTLIAKVYGKKIDIIPDENFVCNSVLDSSLFKSLTGYEAPSWETMITDMHKDFETHYKRRVI